MGVEGRGTLTPMPFKGGVTNKNWVLISEPVFFSVFRVLGVFRGFVGVLGVGKALKRWGMARSRDWWYGCEKWWRIRWKIGWDFVRAPRGQIPVFFPADTPPFFASIPPIREISPFPSVLTPSRPRKRPQNREKRLKAPKTLKKPGSLTRTQL